MRAWGLYLIPRDKAPDEGFLLAHTKKGGHVPEQMNQHGARWKAWWLPLTGTSEVTGEEGVVPGDEQRYYKHNSDLNQLVKELGGYTK